MRRVRAGDRVQVRWVDEEDILSGLTLESLGVVDMELAVGGFLVGFPESGLGVYPEERLNLVGPVGE